MRGEFALLGLCSALAACGSGDDVAFDTSVATLDPTPIRVLEGSGVVRVPLRLTSAPALPITADYRLLADEAQDRCQIPDFSAASGRVVWAPGERATSIEVFIGDDSLAEIDERLKIALEFSSDSVPLGSALLPLVIEDDDRSALLEASDYGLFPDTPGDQSAALQAALDAAALSGRGVLRVAPGSYEVRSVAVSAGITLSARGARFVRPKASAADTITLAVNYAGDADSEPTLLEGLLLDGLRDEQGPFRDRELEDAHLVRFGAEPTRRGRLRGALEGLTFAAATGNGVLFGPNSDVSLCGIVGSDVFRDVVSLRGGNSRVSLRELDASSQDGTTGLWFDGTPRGYGETRFMDVEIDGARLGSGDVEIEAFDGSVVSLRGVTMTRAPFRLASPDGSVKIADSVLQIGVPSERYNFFNAPHDVEIEGSTLVASERIDDADAASEAARQLAIASVRWLTLEDGGVSQAGDPARDDLAAGPHRLVFDRCRFATAGDIEATDRVFAAANAAEEVEVVIRGSTLSAGISDWFAPGCVNCTLEP